MALTLVAFLLLSFQKGTTVSFPEFITPLGGSDNGLSSPASNQCVYDVSIFTNGVKTFMTTLDKCRKNKRGCTPEQLAILQENMFAAKQLDAFGKIPPGVLEITTVSSGSYRECMEVEAPYAVHYCYARAKSDNLTDDELLQTLGLRVAVCMPRSCNEEDIPKVLGSVDIPGLASATFVDSSCVPTRVVPTTAFWIFMSFMAIFVAWAIAATTFDYVSNVYYKKRIESKAIDLFLAFSLYSNSSAILNVTPPKEGNLRCLASIRFISMTWVAAGHTLLENSVSDSALPVLSMWNPLLSTTILNGFFSVDTFFLISGILVAYLFFKSQPSLKYVKNPITWVMFYVHRYLRLTPSMMIFIGFYIVVLPFVYGPYSASLTEYSGTVDVKVEACKRNWWRNLLYINNFYVREGTSKACYNILWYLALDMQFYFIAPIFLILLYVYPLIGGALMALLTAVSIWYVYAVTAWYDLPATIIGAFSTFTGKVDQFFSEYYEIPWARWNPYLIGIIVGYFLAISKERRPKLNWPVVTAAWIIATAVALLSLYGPHRYIKGDDNWNQFVRGTYNNFSRIGWSLAISWVIVANHLGWGGIIATIMEHPLWQPLGRLSYCAYIVHSFVIHYVFNLDDRSPHYVSIWQTYVYRVIPVVVLSYIFAFIWSCLFEAPFIKLEKLLLRRSLPSKRPQANGAETIQDNNIIKDEMNSIAITSKL